MPQHEGLTAWLTGLSGAGKSTIAGAVYKRLLAESFRVEFLDSDDLRKCFTNDLSFSRKDREENVRRLCFVANLLSRHGVIVMVAAIAPYRSIRQEVRNTIGQYVEIFVDAPVHVCEARDPKGLYRRARQGDLKGFTGVDDPYEEPLSPELRCMTEAETVAESVERVFRFLVTSSQSHFKESAVPAFSHQTNQQNHQAMFSPLPRI